MEKQSMKQRVAGFGKFIWNRENKTVLGRGAKSWGEIGIFYLVYYACLSAFFCATIAVFYQTIDSDEPKLMGSSSLLKGNPGVGLRPYGNKEEISIKSRTDPKAHKAFVADMTDFLTPYTKDLKTVDCTDIEEPRRDAKVPCAVDVQNITEDEDMCAKSRAYGMADSAPCILLKLNKVFGWVPDMWKKSELKDQVPEAVKDNYHPNQVWVNCKGKNGHDEKLLEHATIDYFPTQGFPVAFFPYMKQQDYLPPLVFVKFNNVTLDKTIKVECRAYAKNINYDKTEKQGGVEFDLNVD